METILCPIFHHSVQNPGQLALITPEKKWSYTELNGAVAALSSHLREQGIGEGSRVAFIAHSTPATIILFFALFRIGAIACPLSFRIPSSQISIHLQKLAATHFLNEQPILPPLEQEGKISLHQLATFIFTSGSSGSPKVACHSFFNHYSNARAALTPLQIKEDSRWLLSLPLFHVGGIAILFRCFTAGAAIVLTTSPIATALSEFSITHLSLVPTQLFRLVREPVFHVLKCLLLGGAPASTALMEQARAAGFPLFSTYGMSEMSSMVTILGTSHAASEWILAQDGEIFVKGDALFQGYWDPEKEVVSRPDCSGWFPTKDLGKIDAEGKLEWIGRKDRQFISGGENIQPEEIEAVLMSIGSIRNATIVPKADLEFGMRPVAFIDDPTYTLESLREILKEHLPSFKHPIQLHLYPKEMLDQGMKLTPSRLLEYLESL